MPSESASYQILDSEELMITTSNLRNCEFGLHCFWANYLAEAV